MSRIVSRSWQIVIDLAVLAVALWLAFQLRFDWDPPAQMTKRLFFVLPYVVGLEYLALLLFGVTRLSWRYIGLRDIKKIVLSLLAASSVLLVARIVSGVLVADAPRTQYALLPYGVVAANFVLTLGGITGVRVARRMLAERMDQGRRARQIASSDQVPTLLVGAGEAGVLVAKEIAARPDLGILPLGFVDDDPVKRGLVIHGIKVLGTTDEIAELAARLGARQALLTIANAPGKAIRRITGLCDEAGLPAQIIPGMYEIVGGTVNLTRIRPVAIEDLLGREPVALDEDAVQQSIRDRVVLVTGAGGSIGSELCRQMSRYSPRRLVLVEQAENALFHIHRELAQQHPELDVVPCVADIVDAERLEAIFLAHSPNVVLHAAAHKHVPMMEWNPLEAVKNNVFGTKVVADLSDRHGVSEVVMISTDKAVNPTSVMGASKRIAEIYIQALSQRSRTRFVTVRFGNVLGSAGSVIPIFQQQIEAGGPVTVTDPEMQRYFMTIPEACQLVLQAATMGEGGEIFILDMGEPVKIVDLAEDLIRLSGFTPGEDIEISFTGVRPGEKLFEELAVGEESADKTRHPKIYVGRFRPYEWQTVIDGLESLVGLEEGCDASTVRARFAAIVPEYRPAGASPEPPRDAPAEPRVERPRLPTPDLSPATG